MGNNDLMHQLSKPFTGQLQGDKSPILITGKAGSGKTTLAAAFARSCSTRVSYLTAVKYQEAFQPVVKWDEIDTIIIDELGGWDRNSLEVGLTDLMNQARKKQKGVILTAQSKRDLPSVFPGGVISFNLDGSSISNG